MCAILSPSAALNSKQCFTKGNEHVEWLGQRDKLCIHSPVVTYSWQRKKLLEYGIRYHGHMPLHALGFPLIESAVAILVTTNSKESVSWKESGKAGQGRRVTGPWNLLSPRDMPWQRCCPVCKIGESGRWVRPVWIGDWCVWEGCG